MAGPHHVVVVGAGVIGLQTAIFLLEEGYKVTIIAEHFPGDTSLEYTSPWAGAQWRTHAPAEDKEQCDWDIQSYKHWMEMVESDEAAAAKAGVGRYPSEFFWATPTPENATDPWFSQHTSSYSRIPTSNLPSKTHKGIAYTSIALNAPLYIQYLFSRATALGAETIRLSLPTSSGIQHALTIASQAVRKHSSNKNAEDPIAAFMNCTGLSASRFVPDPAVFPIRGQTILVKGKVEKILTKEDSTPGHETITYVLPRIGTDMSLLGGTKIKGDWTGEPNEQTTKEILDRCKALWPEGFAEDGEIEIVAVQVGLRPGRKGGPRVEVEVLRGVKGVHDGKDEEDVVVVHQYGHAGAGFQNSIGSARKAVRLLGERLRN